MQLLELPDHLPVIEAVLLRHFSSCDFLLDDQHEILRAVLSFDRARGSYSLSLFFADRVFFCTSHGDEAELHARAIGLTKLKKVVGDRESLAFLHPHLAVTSEVVSYLEEYDPEQGQWAVGAGVRPLRSKEDFVAMYRIFCELEEYKGMLKGVLSFTEGQMRDVENGRQRSYGLFRGNKCVSCATLRIGKRSCILTGVGTLPEYQNQGFASELVAKVCYETAVRGHKIYLFYLDPVAGHVYRKVGFRELAVWTVYNLEE